jgi:hypothetical protein
MYQNVNHKQDERRDRDLVRVRVRVRVHHFKGTYV